MRVLRPGAHSAEAEKKKKQQPRGQVCVLKATGAAAGEQTESSPLKENRSGRSEENSAELGYGDWKNARPADWSCFSFGVLWDYTSGCKW